MDNERQNLVDSELLLGVVDRFLEHPELVRAIMDAYFDEVDLGDVSCWNIIFTTVCTF